MYIYKVLIQCTVINNTRLFILFSNENILIHLKILKQCCCQDCAIMQQGTGDQGREEVHLSACAMCLQFQFHSTENKKTMMVMCHSPENQAHKMILILGKVDLNHELCFEKPTNIHDHALLPDFWLVESFVTLFSCCKI